MKIAALLAALALLFVSSFADVAVKGYVKKDGTVVVPHHRSDPNGTKNDNWSTKGNVNPYTGKPGTKPRDAEAIKSRPAQSIYATTTKPTVQSKTKPKYGAAAPPVERRQRSRGELENAIRECDGLMNTYARQSLAANGAITAQQYDAARLRKEEAEGELKQLPSR